MTNALVSIIIPVYNVALYLDRCILSAVQQTYRNIEIILVDDGSTDESPIICDDWAKKDPRIKVIHKKNGGVSAARNAGLDIAEGRYISFLDGDDEYANNTLEMALNYYADDVDLVSFGYSIIYPGTKDDILFQGKTYINSTEKDRLSFIIGPFFRFEIGWSVWCNLFLKSVIDEYNIRFQEGHKMTEDKVFCLCYYSHCEKIKVLNTCLYDYYLRNDSVTHISAEANSIYFGEKVDLSKAVRQHFEKYADTQLFVKYFSIIHYFIFEAEIKQEESKGNFSALRERILDDIQRKSDIQFFIDEMKRFCTYSNLLKCYYSSIQVYEKNARAKWLLTGKSFWYKVLVKLRNELL